jgi:hypothetical protein
VLIEYRILYKVEDSFAHVKGGWVGEGWGRGGGGVGEGE